MHVLFMAPHFPANQRQFVRALHAVGAKVTGIGDAPAEYLDGELKSWLHGYEHVANLADEGALLNAVRRIQKREWVDRLECTVEAIMLTTARVREAATIPGLSVDQVLLCRDKFVMKEFLRERGVPCARNATISTIEDARTFCKEVGFPVILKPRDGAGAHDTYRVDDWDGLEPALQSMGIGNPRVFITGEEFITGHEGFYDTLVCDGQIKFEAVSHYYPNVLEAMRTRDCAPYIITTNRVGSDGYNELKIFGRKVIHELGLSTSPTHMEWFFGPRGLLFSEIGARPPGVRFWDLYCWANEIDLYVEWAKALVFGECSPRPSRKYSASLLSIRPNQDGRVVAITGLDEVRAQAGDALGEIHLPAIGQATAPVGSGYMGHGWLHLRHPDYDECRRLTEWVGRTLRIWAR